jgi:hypothetical protein
LSRELGLPLLAANVKKMGVEFLPFESEDLKKVIITSSKNELPIKVTKQPYFPVKELLRNYNASSLSTLQTALYKIKDTEVREHVSSITKAWVITTLDAHVLEKQLKKHLAGRPLVSFVSLMTGTEMLKVRQAILKVKAHPETLKAIAKAAKINAFDLKYLLSTR